jgi:hypothetical protein
VIGEAGALQAQIAEAPIAQPAMSCCRSKGPCQAGRGPGAFAGVMRCGAGQAEPEQLPVETKSHKERESCGFLSSAVAYFEVH